ncbi:hypothetical protein I3760_05G144800 [Carya illinoinensis]|nr:hypothetical protein I3760_05G144800 [Carya illinoinensis]
MDDNAFSVPSASDFRHRWDLFLSFRDEDTRHAFTYDLYKSLVKQGVRVFFDDEGLRGGVEIQPGLFEAIEDSAASIAIISPNYASSHRCLEELSKICKYRRLLLPVFYRVNPSDVRRQRGPFEEHFRNHETTYTDKVMCWRNAMDKAGAIKGWHFDKSESDTEEKEQLIKALVNRVLTELANTVGLATYTIGLGSRLEKLMSVLDVKSNGVRVLGLYGMGGVGKTTLATALYNKVLGHFDCRSFISNVRENSAKDADLLSLQNQLIHDLSSGKSPVYSVVAIKEVLHEKRVLVVLDDVNNVSQLEALTGKREWFSAGSRIIITTRDREVLDEHLVTVSYEVRELDSSDALKLFSYHAMRREKPIDRFVSLSEEMVSLTGGLPLALEVFGSYLMDKRSKEEWEDALQKLKWIRPRHLQDVLKISFDGLDAEEKRIFLDISCLLVKMEMKREDAIDVLKGCGFRAEIAVRVLVTRSLIKITEDNTLWMHDQVRDMGRQIVLDANPLYHNIPSRLWDRDEIMTVLNGGKGTGCIEGIVLDFKMRPFAKDPSGDRISWENFKRSPNFTSALTYLRERHKKCLETKAEREREVILYTKSFESMSSLRLLQINYTRLVGRYKYIPTQLKWLQWKGCPLKNLPSDFCPRELAVLDLSESKIEEVWHRYNNQVAEKLMVMNLRGCHNLVATPDFSGHQKLEKLDLEHCHSLIKIHESIGNVSTLLHLNLSSCWNLVEFPDEVSGLKNLENLILSGCSNLQKLPMDIGDMRSLKELHVDKTAIQELPESIFHLTNLEKLNLNGCQFLTKLPNYVGKLSSLKELSLNDTAVEEIPDSVGSLLNLEILSLIWCESLTSITDSVGNLISLAKFLIHGSAIKELPASIGSLPYLKVLSAGKCLSLSKLPDSIGGLSTLAELQLDQTPITNLPDQVGDLEMLRKLEMMNCKHLKSLPESIGSLFALTSLNISNSNISELPKSIGMLENLVIFRLNKCTQLHILIFSIGNLKSLHHLLMAETAVTELPESFGMLSSLMILKMAKKPHFPSAGNRVPKEDLVVAEQEKHKPFRLPISFSNLCSLEELDARAWNLCGKIPDDFERLSSLEILNLSHNNFFSLPSSLRGLPFLKKLLLPYCEQLKSLPPLPSSLVEVNVANCIALEMVSDISKLESLHELNLANCEKVEDIPGLECLKSLTWLFMSGCKACSSVVKRRLSKVSLRNLRSLSMPGNKIPARFSEEVRFSEHKNHDIKGVIIGVMVSLNPQISDDLRDQLPALPCVRANIVKLNKLLFSTMPELKGVPKTNEDHIYLFRYPDCHPLVSKLRDGYDINVREQKPPFIKGVEVKKCGLYLIFEGDDDYEGDEESLDKSQLSISEKLAKFFSSPEDEDHTSESGIEVESQFIMQETEEEEVWGGLLRLVRGCFCF